MTPEELTAFLQGKSIVSVEAVESGRSGEGLTISSMVLSDGTKLEFWSTITHEVEVVVGRVE